MAIEAPQVTFNRFHETAVEGALAESWAGRDQPTGIVATVAGIPVARFCIGGASENTIDAIDATGDVTGPKLRGVTMLDLFGATSGTAVMYARYSVAPLLRKGKIWMHTIDTIGNDVIPFIVHTGANAGRLSVDANGGASTVAPAGVIVRKGRTGAGLVLVEINLP